MIQRDYTGHEAEHAEDMESEVSLSHIVRTIWSYRATVLLSLALVLVLYLIVAFGYVFFTPSAEIVTLPFDLEFRGSELGLYPNGTAFRASDIVARPTLRQVYEANSLEEYVGFDDFSSAIFIIESNEKLEELRREYEAKLTDAKLSVVDRHRLEEEFELKRESLSKSSYSINMTSNDATRNIPVVVVKKTLDDVLSTWANLVATERGALRYRIPVVTRNILRRDEILRADPVIAIDMLRSKISEIDQNVGDLLAVPGAEVLRGGDQDISLTEIRLNLRDVVRLSIDPLMVRVLSEGLIESRGDTLRFLETQRNYNQMRFKDAQAQISALREALEMYQFEQGTGGTSPGTRMSTIPGSGTETIMPQIDQSFLDRLIEMAGLREDRQYRQALVDEIKAASLEAVPLRSEVDRYEGLIGELKSPADARSRENEIAVVRSELSAAIDEVTEAIDQVNAIYGIFSANLNPPSVLYKVSAPAMVDVQRSVPFSRLVFAGVLVFLIAMPVVLFSVLIHSRVREEEALEDALAREISHPEPRPQSDAV